MAAVPGPDRRNTRRKGRSLAAAGALVVAATLAGVLTLVFLLPGDGGNEDLFPGPEGLDSLVVAGPEASAAIGPAGGVVTLAGGEVLDVPAGALGKSATVTLRRFDRPPGSTPDPFVEAAIVLIVEANAHVAQLEPPARLRVPLPVGDTVALALVNGRWEPVAAAPDGEGLAVEVGHFSSSPFAFIKRGWDWAWDKVPPEVEAQHHSAVEAANPATQQFYGVGERLQRSQAEVCAEFKDVLTRYPSGLFTAAGSIPRSAPGVVALGNFLRQADYPSADPARPPDKRATDPFYWNATAGSMDTIRAALRAKGRQVSPAELLGVAIEANGGNVPLGILAAHNFLKEATYQGRGNADPQPEGDWEPGESVSVDAGHAEVAAMMQTWRKDEPWSPKGRYDKLGPLYHLFATMTAAVWGGEWFGQVAENGEAFLRYFGFGSDAIDPEKGAADTCGREVGAWVLNGLVVFIQPVEDPVEPGKPVPLTLVVRRLREPLGVTFAATSGKASFSRSVLHADLDSPQPDCDRVGEELVCGTLVTPEGDGSIEIEARYKGGVARARLEVGAKIDLKLTWSSRNTKGMPRAAGPNDRAGDPRPVDIGAIVSKRSTADRVSFTLSDGRSGYMGVPSQPNSCGTDDTSGDTLTTTTSYVNQLDAEEKGSDFYVWLDFAGCSFLGEALLQPRVAWTLEVAVNDEVTTCAGSFVYVVGSTPFPVQPAAKVSPAASTRVSCLGGTTGTP